jgi:transcriptional regulator with XRE-family HTH domain
MTEKDKKRVIDFDFFENLTGDLRAPVVTEVEAVGSRIRALRQEKGVSLEDVSRLTGFEVTFLADVEAGRSQPQLGTLIRLSKALDGAFGRLVSGTGTKLYSITRRNERRTVARSTSAAGSKPAYAYKSLAPDVKGRHMEALMVQLTATAEREVSVHDGEEFVFVLEGTVVLEIGGDRFELEPGDSAYYLSTTPHFITAKEGTATILAVLYAQTS